VFQNEISIDTHILNKIYIFFNLIECSAGVGKQNISKVFGSNKSNGLNRICGAGTLYNVVIACARYQFALILCK
jgi:hypothetical protein